VLGTEAVEAVAHTKFRSATGAGGEPARMVSCERGSHNNQNFLPPTMLRKVSPRMRRSNHTEWLRK
jgi:hypothetical protein